MIEDIDKARRTRRARNIAAVIALATIATIAVGEWPMLMCVLGAHAMIWLYYTLIFSADLHEMKRLDDDEVWKSRLG